MEREEKCGKRDMRIEKEKGEKQESKMIKCGNGKKMSEEASRIGKKRQ